MSAVPFALSQPNLSNEEIGQQLAQHARTHAPGEVAKAYANDDPSEELLRELLEGFRQVNEAGNPIDHDEVIKHAHAELLKGKEST